MLLTLALLGCNPEPLEGPQIDVVEAPLASGTLSIATSPDRSERGRAPVREAPLPVGEPILSDCFGNGGRWRGSRGPGAATGAAPPPSSTPSIVRGGGGAPSPKGNARPTRQRKRSSGDTRSAPAAKPTPAPPPEAAAPTTAAPATPTPSRDAAPVGNTAGGKDAGGVGGIVGGLLERATEKKELAKEASHNEQESTARRKTEEEALLQLGYLGDAEAPEADEAEAPMERRLQQEVKPEPVLDWGATVYLSNDDSMSLASAQRVLYGLTHGAALSPSEIRPHELLNYFSFDTAGPPTDQTFSVLGAAEQRDDTLTVSLAVHGANPPRQPLDLTVLLDRSCSMQGEGRMDYTKRGLNLLSDQLQRGDRIDLVLFDSGVCTPLENYVVGRDDPALLTSVISQLAPTGSTDLHAGLQEAYRIQTSRDAADVHQRNRRVLLITDALLNSGNVDKDVVSTVGRAYEDEGIRLTGVGVGRDFDDTMLDKLTEKGKGAYVYLGSEAVVDRIFGPGFDSLTRTIAHDVHFSLDLPDSLAMERFYGEEASTTKADVQPIHYYAGTTQLFLQDLKIRGGTPVRSDPVKMRISYREATTGEPMEQELHTTVGALMDGDPHNLRKGLALMSFSDIVMARAMGGSACTGALEGYRRRAGQLPDDAEIAFVNGLVGSTCGVNLATVVSAGVPFKVKVDADIPIPEVELDCSGRTHLERLSGSDTVARFTAVSPGACTLKLQGNLPLNAAIKVPEGGGDLRCVVRGGRLSCS